MNDTAPRATFRQWETVTLDRMDGAVVQTRCHTVALFRSASGGIIGIVNGVICPAARAVDILRGADTRTVTAEKLEPAPTDATGAAA
ncbi:hypothetical protein GCM10008959_10620 [Deinococcus seoulensis]|uniref:Uncharacterized protein n=1 Tax=Deinococcus seoulensis TaxID=1837379 RepID=A0ABQ2RN13_9DEIO|nr:hypothetical protein [Deinococcus seoulensis]GGR51132.1 hypothetical protein GCM10008959_10620 [Deinococcus seoulensis]